FDKSPFLRRQKGPTVTPDSSPLSDRPTDEERHMAEATARLKMMKLNSIIGNIARIDDQNLRVGDTIEMFTVTEINGRSVSFEAYNKTFVLTMEERQNSAPKRSGGHAPGHP